MANYAGSTNVWVRAGETLRSRFAQREHLDRDAIGIVITDLRWAGGLTEKRKIAAMAATGQRPLAVRAA